MCDEINIYMYLAILKLEVDIKPKIPANRLPMFSYSWRSDLSRMHAIMTSNHLSNFTDESVLN